MKYTIKIDLRARWYCFNGKLHREDGPACEWANGIKHWYLNDKQLTEAEFKAHKT